MKFHFVVLMAVVALTSGRAQCAPTIPVQKTAPALAAHFPLEAKAGGWTFRVLDAAFTWDSTLREGKSFPFYASPRYTLLTQCIAPDGTTQTPANFEMRLLSPSGAPLVNDQVNPDWPWVWAEFGARPDVKTSDEDDKRADGERVETATFEFERPDNGETIPLFLKQKTQSGVEVELREVAFKNSKEVVAKASFQAPETLSDARVTIAPFDEVQLLDKEDKPLPTSGGGGTTWADGTFERTLRFEEPSAKTLSGALPGDKWKLRFAFSVVQRARAQGGRINARLQIPVSLVPRGAVEPLAATAKDAATGVEARIQSGGMPSQGFWDGQLWTRDANPQSGRVWRLKTAKWQGVDGDSHEIWPQTQPVPVPFRSDGSRPREGEYATNLSIIFGQEKRPATLDFSLNLECQRLFDYSFSVQAPVPLSNKSVETDVDVATDSGAPFSLRRVVWFSPTAPLKRVLEGAPKSGLALVFENSPLLTGGSTNLSCVFARDEAGRPLRVSSKEWFSGDATQNADPDLTHQTLVLSLPAPGAKTVSIGVTGREQVATGETARLEVPGVPLPVAPAK